MKWEMRSAIDAKEWGAHKRTANNSICEGALLSFVLVAEKSNFLNSVVMSTRGAENENPNDAGKMSFRYIIYLAKYR